MKISIQANKQTDLQTLIEQFHSISFYIKTPKTFIEFFQPNDHVLLK